MATTKSKKDVIEVHTPTILPEKDLQSVINTALVKGNVTDAIIAQLKSKYGGLKLKSIDDKESYLDIKESRKIVRKVGIAAERICEAGRSEALSIQRLWLSTEKSVSAKIAEVLDPLDAEIKKFEDEEKRKEQRELYANDPMMLIQIGHTVALEFATVAAANNYWK